MKLKAIILTSLICIWGILVYLSCGRDCPVCPKGKQLGPFGHYRLYVWDGYNNLLMSIDTPADTIVDSIHTDFSGYNIFVTPDGERLLALNYESKSTEIFNTADLSHIGSVSQYGDYYFDNSDDFAIFYDLAKETIFFIDPVTLTPFDSICRGIWDGSLDTVNNLFFACKFQVDSIGKAVEEYVIFKIDCNTRTLVDTLVIWTNDSSAIVYVAIPTYNWLTGPLYFHGAHGPYLTYLYQYDPAADSIVSMIWMAYGIRLLAISPDGTTVYATNSGVPTLGVIPDGNILAVNALDGSLKDIIPSFLFPDGVKLYPERGVILPTPDGRRLYVGCGLQGGVGPLVVVDLAENKIINILDFYDNPYHDIIALGPVPDLKR